MLTSRWTGGKPLWDDLDHVQPAQVPGPDLPARARRVRRRPGRPRGPRQGDGRLPARLPALAAPGPGPVPGHARPGLARPPPARPPARAAAAAAGAPGRA